MLEIFLIIAVAITIVLVRKQEQKTKSYYIEFDPDRNVVARKKSMTDSLEEDNNEIS